MTTDDEDEDEEEEEEEEEDEEKEEEKEEEILSRNQFRLSHFDKRKPLGDNCEDRGGKRK